MNPIVAKQVALDTALVAPDQVKIAKCNMRIDPTKTQKEPTYQVVLDTLVLSPCYPAFLITADVLEIYMQQFWFTISKIKDSSSYQFTLYKKKCIIGVEITCTNLGELLMSSSIDAFLGKPQEDLMFQIDNRESSAKRQENMPYPRFTKAIIQHFISKDKSISMRNRLFMHTVKDDSVLGSLKFFSKTKESQVYGLTILEVMTNKNIRNSTTYKTYLAFSTGATTPKKARKFKYPGGSALKMQSLVTPKEPYKKPAARRQPTGVQIRDTPSVSVSKKKAPAKAKRNKGIDLMSEADLLEEA
ncbi:hypothetical protein Tco_1558900 [Tanacetum coccineum]